MKNFGHLILITVLLASCSNHDDNFSNDGNAQFLVSKVFDHQDRLLADYVYNENNLLTKRIFTDPATGNSSDLVFDYTDGRITLIKFIDHNNPNFNNDKLLIYDSSNKIIRTEIFQNGNMINHINYEYSSDGLISHFYKDDGSTYNFYEYDNHRNLISVTNYYTDQITGELTEQIQRFVYDEYRKPSFNLENLFQIDLLPKMGSEGVFERNLSCNNLIFSELSGTTYTYEYNSNFLPVSILTEYEGVITEEPILLKLEYIQK
jgi:hypothetical protein